MQKLQTQGVNTPDTKSQLGDNLYNHLQSQLNPNLPHDLWLEVGQLIHDYDSTTSDGLLLWQRWSANRDNFIDTDASKYWDAFKPAPTDRTFPDYCKIINSITSKVGKYKFDDALKWIKGASEDEIETTLDTQLAGIPSGMTTVHRISLAVQARLSELAESKMPISPIKENVARILNTPDAASIKLNQPAWCNDWVYMMPANKYINLKSRLPCNVHGFEKAVMDLVLTHPHNRRGTHPHCFTKEQQWITDVAGTVYLPSNNNPIVTVELDNVRATLLNTFRPDTVPDTAAEYTDEGKEAIKVIEQHLLLLCDGNETYRDDLMFWLARQVQLPGVLVGWSPLIQGVQGVGKSFVGELLKAVVGKANYKLVTPDALKSDFKGWTHGQAVVVLDEVELAGENRKTIMNVLKPLATETTVSVNNKFVQEFTTLNTMNMIATTEKVDALLLDDVARRWMILYTPFKTKIGFESVISPLFKDERSSYDGYFSYLFGCLKNLAPELRKWLNDYPIPAKKRGLTVAPHTHYKDMMRDTEKGKDTNREVIDDLLRVGRVGKFNKDVIVIRAFTEVLWKENILSIKDLPYVLKGMGYVVITRQYKDAALYPNARLTVWGHSSTLSTNNNIKRLLGGKEAASPEAEAKDVIHLFN